MPRRKPQNYAQEDNDLIKVGLFSPLFSLLALRMPIRAPDSQIFENIFPDLRKLGITRSSAPFTLHYMKSENWGSYRITPRMRVISDNDYAGDPDGLIQLAHHLLSPSVEMRAIISSHLRAGDSWNTYEDSVAAGVAAIEDLLALMPQQTKRSTVPILEGSRTPLKDSRTAADTPAARTIIDEALKSDSQLPLFVSCGGSLTSIASAWLMEPAIAEKLTVVWIGGPEHDGDALPPPGAPQYEYNLHEDVIAAQVLFNESDLTLWQIPRNTYRQFNVGRAELFIRMGMAGVLGDHLYELLAAVPVATKRLGFDFGETYILGDSALVTLTALHSTFEADPSSSHYRISPKPRLRDDGSYEARPDGVPMRIYTHLDARTTLEDLYAKLVIHEANRG